MLSRIEQGSTGSGRTADSGNHTTQLIDRAVNVPLVAQRQVPTIRKTPKTVEIPQFMPLRYMSSACDAEVQKTVELPQVQHIERIVDVTVVVQHQVPTIQSAQKVVEVLQSQQLDRVGDVLW